MFVYLKCRSSRNSFYSLCLGCVSGRGGPFTTQLSRLTIRDAPPHACVRPARERDGPAVTASKRSRTFWALDPSGLAETPLCGLRLRNTTYPAGDGVLFPLITCRREEAGAAARLTCPALSPAPESAAGRPRAVSAFPSGLECEIHFLKSKDYKKS